MNKTLCQSLFVTFACIFLVSPLFGKAASYDAYVDAGYSGEEDGSKSKPFNTISKAIESGAEKIFVGKGKYDEKVTMEKSVKLYGKDKGSSIITGSLVMSDKTLINDITVSGGISVEKNSNASIENCIIESFGLIGIDIAQGNGKLVVSNTKIHGGEGKGMYIQAGNEVRLTGNEIYKNPQEGIDVRANVTGLISGNSIYDNGESGIEIIAGSSEVAISKNTIKGNHASGIAAQFYKENKKIGNISIENNVMSKNGKYGLDCAIPSGGAPSADYWSNSLNLNGNTIENNKIESINDFCDIISVVEKEDEEKDNKITESAASENRENSNLSDEELDKQEEILKGIESIKVEVDSIKNIINKSEEKINRRKFLVKLIVGQNLKESENLDKAFRDLEDRKNQLTDLSKQATNDELRQEIDSMISQISEEVEKCKNLINRNESGFSFYGRLFEWLYNYEIYKKYLIF